MIKLIVSDLDGTLLPYGEGRISDRTLECLSEAIDRGIVAAVRKIGIGLTIISNPFL